MAFLHFANLIVQHNDELAMIETWNVQCDTVLVYPLIQFIYCFINFEYSLHSIYFCEIPI